MKVWRICMTTPLIIAIIIFLSLPSFGAEMEWDIRNKIDLESPAVDMVMSPDGKRMFILDENGDLKIFDMNGGLEGTITVGKNVNRIIPGIEPDTLLLSNQKKKAVEELTLNFVYDINIEGSPFRGPQDAPVIITLFTDFQCPYCAQMGPIIEEVFKAFPKEIKLVYKSFPLRNHQYAIDAAKAAMAAHKMGKFWEFHDLLFKNYNKLNKEKIDAIREELKLDKKEFDQHANDPEIMNMIRNDYKNAIDAGVRGTPSLFINGKQCKDRNPKALIESIRKELQGLSSKKQ